MAPAAFPTISAATGLVATTLMSAAAALVAMRV